MVIPNTCTPRGKPTSGFFAWYRGKLHGEAAIDAPDVRSHVGVLHSGGYRVYVVLSPAPTISQALAYEPLLDNYMNRIEKLLTPCRVT